MSISFRFLIAGAVLAFSLVSAASNQCRANSYSSWVKARGFCEGVNPLSTVFCDQATMELLDTLCFDPSQSLDFVCVAAHKYGFDSICSVDEQSHARAAFLQTLAMLMCDGRPHCKERIFAPKQAQEFWSTMAVPNILTYLTVPTVASPGVKEGLNSVWKTAYDAAIKSGASRRTAGQRGRRALEAALRTLGEKNPGSFLTYVGNYVPLSTLSQTVKSTEQFFGYAFAAGLEMYSEWMHNSDVETSRLVVMGIKGAAAAGVASNGCAVAGVVNPFLSIACFGAINAAASYGLGFAADYLTPTKSIELQKATNLYFARASEGERAFFSVLKNETTAD